MPIKPGQQLWKQRKTNAGGRPPRTEVEVLKAAADIAREYIDASVKPVMRTYFQLAHGRLVNKWHEGKIVGQEFEADAPTTRHFIEQILPKDQQSDSGQTLNIFIAQGTKTAESGLAPELRGNGIQVRIGGNNGQNGNGSDGA